MKYSLLAGLAFLVGTATVSAYAADTKSVQAEADASDVVILSVRPRDPNVKPISMSIPASTRAKTGTNIASNGSRQTQ